MIAPLVGRLSILGAPPPPPGAADLGLLLRRSRVERTLPIVCRNLGIRCPLEPAILERQILAARQAAELRRHVEFLPLKGLHLAHRVYPTPALRDMGDLDVLVRRGELPAADAALRGLGYRPEHDPARVAEGDGTTLNAVVYFREGDLPVHLHWKLSNASLPHFMYRIDAEEVWRAARGGEMARHHLVVALCEHALKHSFDTLLHLSDIELAARGADGGLVAETARRWGLERAVYYARVLLRDLAGVDPPGLRRVRVERLGEGALFLRAARARRWSGLSALGLLSMARGAGEKVRFVREALWPKREASEGFESRTLGARIRRAGAMILRGLTSPRGRGPGH